jgi:CheY-like chemotaxis protein
MVEGRELRILLVDDDASDAKLTQRWLIGSPLIAEVHVAPSGEQALDQLRATCSANDAPQIGLILLDVNLPRMSGFETLAELRSQPEWAELPVIMLSSSSFREDQKRARQLEANLYLSKPCDADEFAEFVRTVETFWQDFSRGAASENG